MVQCPKCGMSYVAGLEDNESQHQYYCDFVTNGPLVKSENKGETIFKDELGEFQLVTAYSHKNVRKVAYEAAVCANKETGFDGAAYNHNEPPNEGRVHIFLYVRGNRALGMVMFELQTDIDMCNWNDPNNCVKQPEIDSMWCVDILWTHKNIRGSGIAYKLFDIGKKYRNYSAGFIYIF